MAEFPFPADTITNNRFHGVLQGTFELEDGTLRLRTPFGLIRLYPRPGKDGKRPFRAAYRNHEAFPDAELNVYGYPRTNEKGVVERLEMVSFNTVGSPDPDGPLSVSRRFEPNQMFLCGRVRGLENGLVTVKVKSVVGDRDLSWRVTGMLAGKSPQLHSKVLFSCGLAADGLLVIRPLKLITPAGRPTVSTGSSRHSSVTQFSRISVRDPLRSRELLKRSDSRRLPSQQQKSSSSAGSSEQTLRRFRQQSPRLQRQESPQGSSPFQRPLPVQQRRPDGQSGK